MSLADVENILAAAVPGKPAQLQPLQTASQPAQPYPVEALGDTLGNPARAIQDIVRCPVELGANSLLSVASLAVQAHANVIIPATGQPKPLSLYLFSIAKSGERKTSADEEALAPIRAYERDLHIKYAADMPSYENLKAAWDVERAKVLRGKHPSYEARGKALDAVGPAPEVPLLPILISPEPTYEGFCKLLSNSPPMQGIFSSEGGMFIGGHAMKDDAKLRSAAGFSELWDGTPIKRVRAGDGVSILRGRRLAIHLMVQQEAGGMFMADPLLRDQGLISRILVSAPESTAGTRMQRPPHPNSRPLMAHYTAHILKILNEPPLLAPMTRNELTPRDLHLAEDAKQRWTAYANEVELKVKRYKEYDCISGFAGKMPEHAVRIAGVLTLVENIKAAVITLDTLNRAIELTNYYASEAVRLTHAGFASRETTDAALLWDWIRHEWREEHIGISIIENRGPGQLRRKERAHAALSKLAEHNYLVPAPGGTLVDGRKVKQA